MKDWIQLTLALPFSKFKGHLTVLTPNYKDCATFPGDPVPRRKAVPSPQNLSSN